TVTRVTCNARGRWLRSCAMADRDGMDLERAGAAPGAAQLAAKSRVLATLDEAGRSVLATYLTRSEVPEGTAVVKAGERERAMYFVLAGEAMIKRGELDLGRVRAGEHFGELGLVADRPRAASVV